MTLAPDDARPRSGSSTALLMTIVGMCMRRLDGWIATSDLVTLAGEVDITPAMTRTAITRLKKREILVSERRHGVSGYGLQPLAIPLLARGDRRIFTVRTMRLDDPWCL